MDQHTKKLLYRSLKIAGIVVLLLAIFKYWRISSEIAAHANFAPPPVAVTSIIAKESTWQQTVDVVGTLEPVQGAVLSAEHAGKVAKVGFESGAQVKKGDVLIQLDTAVEDADLASAQALLDLARINLERARTLQAKAAMSESSLNNAVAEEKNARGRVESLRATIARKSVIAPFDGRAGIRMVNVGQYVSEGEALVPLQAIDNLYLNFFVPERSVADIKVGETTTFKVDAVKDEVFSGVISAINPQVDPATRNVKIQAMIQNTQGKLLPGMFCSVKVPLDKSLTAIGIPGSSVSYAPYGNSVYVIEKLKNPKGVEYSGVTQKFVQLGESRGDQVAVTHGISVGEEIVTSGIFKLRPGAGVAVNNSIVPGNDLDPHPANN